MGLWFSGSRPFGSVVVAHEAQDAVADFVGGLLDRHSSCFDFVFGGAREREAGGEEPCGGWSGVEVAGCLSASDEGFDESEHRPVSIEVVLWADWRGVPYEWVPGAGLPDDVEQLDQRLGRWEILECRRRRTLASLRCCRARSRR